MSDETEPIDDSSESADGSQPADPADEADVVWQTADDEATRRRRDQRVGSERISAYADAMTIAGDLLYPAFAGDEVTPRRRSRLDPLLRGELELALRAMAADIRRLAGGVPREEE